MHRGKLFDLSPDAIIINTYIYIYIYITENQISVMRGRILSIELLYTKLSKKTPSNQTNKI